jgi:branched-chain amino acid transport system substrate-binding protein
MKKLAAVLAFAALAAIVVTQTQAARPDAKPKKPAPCVAKIGLIDPLTGPAAVIGQEIKNWSQFGLDQWNKAHRTKFSLVEGDTQLSAAVASTIAQQFVSNSKIVATIGPAASQEVVAAGPIFSRARMAMVSPSATRTDLTDGSLPTFFRVVARDDSQGPTAANFLLKTLKVKRVTIVDDQSSFSTGLAESAAPVFQRAGVTVDRESVSQTTTDYSSLVAKVGNADAVFLTWQLPANIKLFVQQLKAQGRSVPTFATTFDGGTDYVSSFAINIHTYAPDAAIRNAFEKKYGTNYTGQFGPPSFVSAQVIASAITSLCANHRKITRVAVVAAIRKVKFKKTILGRPVAFDRHGDVANGRFYVYKLVNGTYRLVS